MTDQTPEELAEERRRFVADLLLVEGITPTKEAFDLVIDAGDRVLGDLDNWRPTGLLNAPGIAVAPEEPTP